MEQTSSAAPMDKQKCVVEFESSHRSRGRKESCGSRTRGLPATVSSAHPPPSLHAAVCLGSGGRSGSFQLPQTQWSWKEGDAEGDFIHSWFTRPAPSSPAAAAPFLCPALHVGPLPCCLVRGRWWTRFGLHSGGGQSRSTAHLKHAHAAPGHSG